MITENNIFQRNKVWILQKTFAGVGQKQIRLGKDKRIAKNRALRFLATAEVNGFDSAMEELKGKQVLKKGDDPTFDQMKVLYMEYLINSGKQLDTRTIKTNIGRLKNVMDRCGFKTVGQIDKSRIKSQWFKQKTPNSSERRTFASAIRAASSIFKKAAMDYYASKNLKFKNPFIGLELENPKVEAYQPISEMLRKSIWDDCQTELLGNEAMIVIMALGIGMRREEIEAAKCDWLSVQNDKVLIHIREEQEFVPKAHESGQVPFSLETYKILMKLRGESKSKYFVPYSDKKPTDRLFTPATKVCEWLRKKGLDKPKPIQTLRQELGSHVAKHHGILEASKILRNDPQVCAIHYAGIAETHTVDMGASFNKPKTPEETFAAYYGLKIDELLKKLGGISPNEKIITHTP
jgi:integrase